MRRFLALWLALALLWGASPARAGYVFVNSGSAGATDATTATTGGINTTGANLIWLVVSFYTGCAGVTVSDSQSNTWTALTPQTSGGAPSVNGGLYYSSNPTTNAAETFSATGSNCFPSIAALAFSGAATSSPQDQQNGSGAGAANVSTIQPGSVTPSQNNELIIAGYNEEAVITGLGIDSGFTLQEHVTFLANNHFGVAAGYLIQTSAAAVNPTWSWTNANPAATEIATFEAQPAGGGGAPATLLLLDVGR